MDNRVFRDAAYRATVRSIAAGSARRYEPPCNIETEVGT